MRFKVTVVRYWEEAGWLELEAEDADDAREQARDILADGGEEVEWGSMESTSDDVEGVQPL